MITDARRYSPSDETLRRLREIAATKNATDSTDPMHRRWNENLNIIGLLGEALFSHLAAFPVGDLTARRDGGSDFPGVDAKASAHWDDPYLKWKPHERPKAPVYFLAAADPRGRRVRPVGFATRAMVEQAALRDFGHGPMRSLHEGELLSAYELIPRLYGEPTASGWQPEFTLAAEPSAEPSGRVRDDSWLCSACRHRGLRPVYPAVRDGLCGWCWLEERKTNGGASLA